jgi:hypothetical protein
MNVLLSAIVSDRPRRYGQRRVWLGVWSYDELTDFEFLRNYRMTKDQFRHLVTRIRHRLPGATGYK